MGLMDMVKGLLSGEGVAGALESVGLGDQVDALIEQGSGLAEGLSGDAEGLIGDVGDQLGTPGT